MDGEAIPSKKPDEIYCPNCAKPINKEAVICPSCGVQVKELKTTIQTVPLTPVDEISEGKKLLGGIKVWFWVVIVTFGLAFIILFIVNIVQIAEGPTVMSQVSFILTFFFAIAVWLALFIVPLVAMAQRKPFAVPFTRAMIVISMFWVPIGTIIGAVLWGRINHPYAKKYLNYLG